MASSEVELCQMALSHIRGGSLNDLNEPSVQAQRCKLLYPNLRDFALAAAPWGFNRKQAALQLRTDTVFGWANLYQYPSDCLRINRLILNYSTVTEGDVAVYRSRFAADISPPDLTKQVEHRIFNVAGKKVIATNYPDLRIEYGVKVTDVTLFDIEFDLALSHLLASHLAIPVVGGDKGESYQKTQLELFGALVAEAIASSLNEDYSPPVDSELVTIRT